MNIELFLTKAKENFGYKHINSIRVYYRLTRSAHGVAGIAQSTLLLPILFSGDRQNSDNGIACGAPIYRISIAFYHGEWGSVNLQ